MEDGSSQGLFVIVAVVIFGIFIVISYLLFRDKLQTGLASIFDDSIVNSEDSIKRGDNLINKSSFEPYLNLNVTGINGTEKNVTKKVINPNISGATNERSHILYTYIDNDLKVGDKYAFSVDVKVNNVSSKTLIQNTVNIRYLNSDSSGKLTHFISEHKTELNTVPLDTWENYTVEIEVKEPISGLKLENQIRASISINGNLLIDFNYRNPQLVKVTK